MDLRGNIHSKLQQKMLLPHWYWVKRKRVAKGTRHSKGDHSERKRDSGYQMSLRGALICHLLQPFAYAMLVMAAGRNPDLSLHLGWIKQWYPHVIAEISCRRLTVLGTCNVDCQTLVPPKTHQIRVGDRAGVGSAGGMSGGEHRILKGTWARRRTLEGGWIHWPWVSYKSSHNFSKAYHLPS